MFHSREKTCCQTQTFIPDTDFIQCVPEMESLLVHKNKPIWLLNSYQGTLMPYFQCQWLAISASLKILYFEIVSMKKIHAVPTGRNSGAGVSPDGIMCPSIPIEKENSLLHWTLNLLFPQVPSLLIPTGPASTLDPLCLKSPPKTAAGG